MVTKIGKDNLDKDMQVQGENWLFTYGSYFSDEENIQIFIDTIKPFLPDQDLDILYIGSASGLLGERLINNLKRGQLTLVDISQKHLDTNTNPQTKKICIDILEMDLKKRFDLIIIRSFLDYFPTEDLQIQVLTIIKKHLKVDGIFINQPAYIPDLEERDLVSKIYTNTPKIGNRLFQSIDMDTVYQKAGFETPIKVGEGKLMNLSEKDHIERYNLTENEVRDIQNIIGNNFYNYAKKTTIGYNLKFEFPIFLTKN